MKKKTSTEMEAVRQKRFPTDSDLGSTTAIPRCTEYDLKPAPRTSEEFSWRESTFDFKVPRPGGGTRKDGRA